MSYTLDKRVDGEFDNVVERTTNALSEEGFGVLCDIDVQQTLKKKLDEDFRQYRILGACNPRLRSRLSRRSFSWERFCPVTSSCMRRTRAKSA